LAVMTAVAAFALPSYALAEMRGVTATESKIGQTMPYSGPVSAFGALGKGEVGYFKMAGRRLRAAENHRADAAAVESDEVALIFSSIGTAAVAKYLQSQNVPQLFGSGASKFADRAQYPQATLGVRAGAVPLRGAAVCARCATKPMMSRLRPR
jgi:branched-chain amino acid transport system substrate-binding protein